MKILIIEDDIPLTVIYENICKETGYDTIIAKNGGEALDAIKKYREIGVVLLDRHLPDTDGFELCRIIREKFGSLDKYIVLITGDDNNDSHLAGLDAGADDFIAKPIDLNILQRRVKVGIRSVLAHRTLLEQKAVTEKLYHENEFFKTGFDDSVQPYFITDLNGEITYANKAVESFYGYDLDKLIGSNTKLFNPGVKEYINRGHSIDYYESLFTNLWESILDPAIGNWEGDLINKTKSGEMKDVHLQIGSIHDNKGEKIGFTSFVWDLTEFIQRERINRHACFRTIVDLAEVRDNETGQHLKRISKYSVLMARELGMTKKFIDNMENFAPFHDIGKVGVPDSILLAPRKLTDAEFDVIKTHPTIGYDILKKAETLKFAADIAYFHHEKWNGKGYPNGASGEDIPLCGRITALVDVYDALRAKRPYKEPWPHDKVYELINSERGEHFDPELVDVFNKIHTKFEEISEKYI